MAAKGSAGLDSEPNVVPMIDVLLVLLIIFMAALPSMRKAIDVQLPDPNPQTAVANPNSDQIVLEVLPDGQYTINKNIKLDKSSLGPKLREIYDVRPEKIIFVKGDPTVKYQEIIEAMDVARGSGVRVIGVPPKDPPAAPAAGATSGR
jgi:biopolymer transport protein ExbD